MGWEGRRKGRKGWNARGAPPPPPHPNVKQVTFQCQSIWFVGTATEKEEKKERKAGSSSKKSVKLAAAFFSGI